MVPAKHRRSGRRGHTVSGTARPQGGPGARRRNAPPGPSGRIAQRNRVRAGRTCLTVTVLTTLRVVPPIGVKEMRTFTVNRP